MNEQNQVQEKPVQTLESLGLAAGKYTIAEHPKHKGLVNRTVEVTKAGKKPGVVNGHLINKAGERQKTEISILAAALKPYVEPVAEETPAAPVAAEATA